MGAQNDPAFNFNKQQTNRHFTILCRSPPDAGCPSGFVLKGSACVHSSGSPATFSAARTACHDLSAELYEPREPGLLADVRELVAKSYRREHWIGLEEKVGVQSDRHGACKMDVTFLG